MKNGRSAWCRNSDGQKTINQKNAVKGQNFAGCAALTAGLLLSLSGALNPVLAAENQGVAQGMVFADANGNGQMDEGEAGVAGVAVSNGRDIVRSDAQGHYQIALAADDDSMIFVLKPRDYALPRSAEGVPQFWHPHDPDGSPRRRYVGALPSGPLPEQLNFALIPQPEPDRFTVAMMADPQVKDPDEVEYYRRDVVASISRHQGISLGFSLGDIVQDDLSLYPAMNEATASLGIPWFNVFGNHDMNLDADNDAGSDDTFARYYGPTTYALQYGPVHFIYFDDVIHWLDAEGKAEYHGGLTDQQFQFISNYLKQVPKQEWVVLMMHIPLVDRQGENAIRHADLERLANLLSPFPRTLSISGHTHLQQHFYLGAEDGWRGREPHYHYNIGAASGSWWSGDLDAEGIPDTTMRDGTPNGYALIEFSATDFRIDYHAARAPLDEHLRVYGPGPVIRGSYPIADVYVNVYNGEANDVVEYQVDNGPWQAMRRVNELDPFVLEQNLRRMNATQAPRNDRLSAAIPSTHLWKGRMATDLYPGNHQLRVRTRDRYGREFSAERSFPVVELEPPH